MVKSIESTPKMSVRRASTTANGYVQSRNSRARRRNAVANIFSELSEGDVRALRQQAQDTLHPAAMGASPPCSSADSSSSSAELGQYVINIPSEQRRRRNALHDIGLGIDHAELQQLRDQALAMHHPAAMMTTPPGAAGAAAADTTPRSVSMMASAAGAVDNFYLPDESGAFQSETQGGPSHIFTVDSITSAVHAYGTSFPRSVSSNVGTSSHQQPSASACPDAITITETDGDIFRERIARSCLRYAHFGSCVVSIYDFNEITKEANSMTAYIYCDITSVDLRLFSSELL